MPIHTSAAALNIIFLIVFTICWSYNSVARLGPRQDHPPQISRKSSLCEIVFFFTEPPFGSTIVIVFALLSVASVTDVADSYRCHCCNLNRCDW